ncbi:HAMP domain-containing histidine kinase [Paenibacillus sp. sptzw28]|uniref:sensor histidine kinase n=1 Tax=Paenibacillus sp. sptzw28 TaxID=715179 RepID=UPI001C6F025F|nr:HAMP domain-containing histidine kinase [Paenibacillus sp. sptzw28]QYR19523.1 HAMP domain-containing histidine kinase [Paenibacillus sp. sptzw28]
MTALIARINALPVKWRLTLWSSLFIIILFACYSGAQYLILNRWAMSQEQQTLQKSFEEIQGYFADKASTDIAGSRSFLGKVNQSNQMIRILDDNGRVVLTISDILPSQWVLPQVAEATKLVQVWHGDDHLLILRSPLILTSFTGTIEIVRDLETYEKVNHIMLLIMAVGGLIGIAVGILGAVLLARQLVKPVAVLTETMGRITHNGLNERVDFIPNKDELSVLSQMFNEMMDRLSSSFQQQKQFVEDASHELRTPIAIIEGHLAMLQRWGKRDPAILDESLKASLQELARLKKLSQELLTLSRAEALTQQLPELIDPILSIRQLTDDFAVLYPAFTFNTDYETASGVLIAMNEDHWKQILIIILDNAVKYSGDKKVIRLHVTVTPERLFQLKVTDYGIGIPEEEVSRVFDRFYRVDKARSRTLGGSGLGLSIAKRMVEGYQGAISITSKENHGTIVTVTLPHNGVDE